MKSWYTIRARTSGTEVLIYDEIGAYGVTAKGFLAELGALPDDAVIDLRLNSPGGSVFDAVAIYNALKRHLGEITVWIDGIAASAASYIAMAGDIIVMPENAFLMIHDPSGLVMGTAEDMRSTAEALDKVKDSLIQGYAAKSGKSDDEIATLMAAETWLDAKDALELGFIDRIAEPVKLAASFDVARFRNAPPSLIEAVAETVGSPDGFEDDPDQPSEATPPAVPKSDVGNDNITAGDIIMPAENISAPVGQEPGVSDGNTRASRPYESSVAATNLGIDFHGDICNILQLASRVSISNASLLGHNALGGHPQTSISCLLHLLVQLRSSVRQHDQNESRLRAEFLCSLFASKVNDSCRGI